MDITDYAAIYAVIIATSALVWNILREWRKVKVKLEFNLLPTDQSGETGEIIQVGFTVINDSRYPAYVERVGFAFSDGFEYGYDHSTFKVDRCVRPGMSTTVWVDTKSIKSHSEGRIIRFGFVQDATFKTYRKTIPKWVAKAISL